MEHIKTMKLKLVYPDLEWVLQTSGSLYDAMNRYRNYTEIILMNITKYKDCNSQEEIDIARYLLAEFLNLQDRYIDSYKDLISRESMRKTTGFFKFFKDLEVPIAQKNPNITFDFFSRFKSYYKFIQKCITKLETLDLAEVLTIFDIQAMKLTVHTYAPVSKFEDYETAHDECYQIFNNTVELIREHGGELIQLKSVGPSDQRVNILYQNMIKDYIKNPKTRIDENDNQIIDYQALHAAFEIVLDRKKKKFEIQVNSLFMHENAYPHDQYKLGSKLLLPVDFSKIMYSDFLSEKSDRCGLLIAKEITKIKKFQKKE